MCLMAPLRVESVEPGWCLVSGLSRSALERVSTLLADPPDLKAGDWVLVTGGTVVRRLSADQAEAMREAVGIAFGPPTHPLDGPAAIEGARPSPSQTQTETQP